MPSPFPGMDPYLEGSPYWQGFHNSLMTYLRDALQPVLPANYIATLELRVYVEREPPGVSPAERVPDVELVRTGAGPARHEGEERERNGGNELRGYWIEQAPVEIREAFVNIRSAGDEELVTSIELLSPTNKRPGEGRRAYQRKQAEVIGAGKNLVEIDLLRGGLHTVAVLAGGLAGLPPFHYLFCVYRSARPWGFQVIPWALREPLPPLPVPLAAEDPELEVDLQQLFTQAYDNGVFRRLLRYDSPPQPLLAGDEAEWSAALLDPGSS